ncbi:pentapeptide repeat-containing protein [Amycolatopsis sp. NPDC051045]|uniref:pentapeptide repeat-containing protein n=1 Tax=Amycolatopsis sp. NPDC051045 TaxID=3156922 RepID=UPI003437A528
MTFTGVAAFDRAVFSGYAGFDWVTFAGAARFHRTTFADGARFVGATCKGRAFDPTERDEPGGTPSLNELGPAK